MANRLIGMKETFDKSKGSKTFCGSKRLLNVLRKGFWFSTTLSCCHDETWNKMQILYDVNSNTLCMESSTSEVSLRRCTFSGVVLKRCLELWPRNSSYMLWFHQWKDHVMKNFVFLKRFLQLKPPKLRPHVTISLLSIHSPYIPNVFCTFLPQLMHKIHSVWQAPTQ